MSLFKQGIEKILALIRLPNGTITDLPGTTAGNVAVSIEETNVTVTSSSTGNVAHDDPDSGNPVKIGGRAQEPTTQPDEVADNDRVDALYDRNGYLRVRGDFNPQSAVINATASGNNTIIASPGAGKRIAVWSFYFICEGTVLVRWESGASGTAITGQMSFKNREGVSVSAGGIVPLFVVTANTLLNMELSSAVLVQGGISYTVIDD
jgi:hypothetical protein